MREWPRQSFISVNATRLCYFEWGVPGQPQVLLVHATGFHARCWDATVAALPPGYHVLAVDMRGHGRSDKTPPQAWSTFGADLLAFVQALDIRDAVGVGHSMGGHSLTQVCARAPQAFARMLLIDPVIFEPDAYPEDRHRGYAAVDDHPVARRRDRFESWQAMRDRFADRAPFSLWRPDVLDDYCRYGTLPAPDGDGVQLACPPRVEAAVYLGNTSTDVHGDVAAIRVPVDVLRAPPRDAGAAPEMDFAKSPTWPPLAGCFAQGVDVFLPELTHFIPMQVPELVAGYIVDRAPPT